VAESLELRLMSHHWSLQKQCTKHRRNTDIHKCK